MLAPAAGVAIWDDSEDALEADGAEEVLLGGLVLRLPALLPRTFTRLDHRQQFEGVRTPVRTAASCQIFEVLHVARIFGDQVYPWRLFHQVVVHPLCGLRRDTGEEGLILKGILVSGQVVVRPSLGLLEGLQLVSLPLLVLANPPRFHLFQHHLV